MPLIDVSHTVESGMLTYKGLPAPIICDYLSREASRKLYASGTEFQIGRIDMVANTGTFLDGPFHRYSEGKDLSELPLDSSIYVGLVTCRNMGPSFLRCRSRSKALGPFLSGHSRRWKASAYAYPIAIRSD